MDTYTFAKNILKIKSETEINILPGFQRYAEHMTDCDIMHSFTVKNKIKEEISGGYYYAWYEVDGYSADVTKSQKSTEKLQAVQDYNVMMGVLQDPTMEENENGTLTEI